MVVKNGKIAEATEDELFDFWLHHYSDIFDFYYFLRRCQELGTNVVYPLKDRKEKE